MPPVTTNLSQEDIDRIDDLAAGQDLSRSAWIREAILTHLYGGPITLRRRTPAMARDTGRPAPAAPETIRAGKPGDRMRWAFLAGLDIGADGDPYLDRLRIVQTPLFGIYLHHIHRPDRDRDPHDHPWTFASLVLAGGYQESVWPDKCNPDRAFTRHRRRFSLRCLNRDAAHTITRVNGPLWTLVLTGPRRADWGFWVNGRFVPWRKYLGVPGDEEARDA